MKKLLAGAYLVLILSLGIAVSALIFSANAVTTHGGYNDTAAVFATSEETFTVGTDKIPRADSSPDMLTAPDINDVYGNGEFTYTADEIAEYFKDIVFSSEFDGYVGNVCRWEKPIKYRIYGEMNEEDTRNFNALTAYLNSVAGFPGMSEASDDSEVNFEIYYTSASAMPNLFSNYAEGGNGMATFWWDTSTNEILRARTAIVIDGTDQEEKNTVTLEEITQALGIGQDSYRYPESLYYQFWSTPQTIPFIDKCVIEILYSDKIHAGMPEAEAIPVIREIIPAICN